MRNSVGDQRSGTHVIAEHAGVNKGSAEDLRSFLHALVEHDADQLVVVDQDVDPVFEATAIVDRMETDPRFAKYPGVLFKRIKGSRFPLLINLHGSYERLAFSIGAGLRDMVEEYSRRERRRVPAVRVDRAAAPVKEVVWTGADVDLGRLPLLQHQELDAGKYVTAGVSVTRDPVSGAQNAGIFRAQLHSPTELGFMTGHYQNTQHILQAHRELGRPMQVAMAIGHHPAVLLAATTKPGGLGGEYEVAGGLLGQPLEVVRGETVDLDVPARAEIVIEGVVDPDPASFRHEGPFGEYPRYYTGTGPQPVLRVTAVTMRRDPIFVDVFNAAPEHLALGGLARMGFLLSRLRDVSPRVTGVFLPLSASARLHAYVSLRKRSDGEPHLAAFSLLAHNPTTKHVFLVDDDIDVTNEAEVLWAMATRFQADKDLAIIPNSIGGYLNPPTYAYRRDEKGAMETKLIFDCTRPAGVDFPARTRVPPEVAERMDPGAYTRGLSAGELAGLTGGASGGS